MRRKASPGFAEWIFVTFVIVGSVVLLYQLYQYGQVRQQFPTGLTVAGIDVSGKTPDEVELDLTDRYISADIIIHHGNQQLEFSPELAEFKLNFDTMMTNAIYERDQQDFWAGFWGYLWGRPVDVSPVELSAVHNETALREALRILSEQLDADAELPKAVSDSMSFAAGEPGVRTNIEASIDDVTAALYRHRSRDAYLSLDIVASARPDINLLGSLLTNSIQQFEAQAGGVGSAFVMDLRSGEEIGYNAAIPMSGMSVLRLPIAVQAMRFVNESLTPEEFDLFLRAAIDNDNATMNDLLRLVSDEDDDGFTATEILTASFQQMGLVNTYISCPFDVEERLCSKVETPANQVRSGEIEPSDYYQTTAEDIGILLADLHYCAKNGGGTLIAIYGGELSQNKCQLVLDFFQENQIGSLIEEGVPANETVIHRHGWQSDTYGDAALVYSTNGEYVIVEFMHKPGWLAWEVSSPLMADLSRAAYNYFNFESITTSQLNSGN